MKFRIYTESVIEESVKIVESENLDTLKTELINGKLRVVCQSPDQKTDTQLCICELGNETTVIKL